MDGQRHQPPDKGRLANLHNATPTTTRQQGKRGYCRLQLTIGAPGSGPGVGNPGDVRPTTDARGRRALTRRQSVLSRLGQRLARIGRAPSSCLGPRHIAFFYRCYLSRQQRACGLRCSTPRTTTEDKDITTKTQRIWGCPLGRGSYQGITSPRNDPSPAGLGQLRPCPMETH